MLLASGETLDAVAEHEERLVDLLVMGRVFRRSGGVGASQVDHAQLAVGGLVLQTLLLVALFHQHLKHIVGPGGVGGTGETVLDHFDGPFVAAHLDFPAVGHVHASERVFPDVEGTSGLGARDGHQVLQVLVVDGHEGNGHGRRLEVIFLHAGEEVLEEEVGQPCFGLGGPVEESVGLA